MIIYIRSESDSSLLSGDMVETAAQTCHELVDQVSTPTWVRDKRRKITATGHFVMSDGAEKMMNVCDIVIHCASQHINESVWKNVPF